MDENEIRKLKKEQEELIERLADLVVDNFLDEYDAYKDMPLEQMVCEKSDILDVFNEESERINTGKRDLCNSSRPIQLICSMLMISPNFLKTTLSKTNRIGMGSIERFLRSYGFDKQEINECKKEIRICLE